MQLQAGEKLGPYRIVAPLGAGGMGVVYRAHDTRVGRDVAVKVTDERFTSQFEREGKAIAALNHPNISQLYDVGENYLVMELVEGETLRERFAGGPIAWGEALPIALQIAEALSAAHERGITHRDLKPENIKIRADGTVKVLDFGIAKFSAPVTLDDSSTLTLPETAGGALVGTAPYMAPEQARGLPVDKRADIWAFGVILYEMLTGRRLFARDTFTDTLAAILREDPDLEQVLPTARRLVRACLQKDPRNRLSDISDAKLLIEDQAASPEPKRTWPLGWIAVCAILIAALAGFGSWRFRARPPAALGLMRFELSLPEHTRLSTTGTFEISPDGKSLVYSATGEDGIAQLWLRQLDQLTARPLPGTKSPLGIGVAPFFWSPDSRYVVFDGGTVLKKIEVAAGTVQTTSQLPGVAVGGSWGSDGTILVGNAVGGLLRLSTTGNGVTEVTVVDSSRKEFNHTAPCLFPGGRHFAYNRSSSESENAGVYAGSLDAAPQQQHKRLLPFPSTVQFVQGDSPGGGWLLFHRDGALLAQPLDLSRMEFQGGPVKVIEPIGAFIVDGFFSASATGVLVYRSGAAAQRSKLVWVDRLGGMTETAAEADGLEALSLAPNGKHAAAAILKPDRSRVLLNIWSIDLENGGKTRLTFGLLPDDSPVWSPDGRALIFNSARGGPLSLYRKEVFGPAEAVVANSRENRTPMSWSSDGRYLMYEVADAGGRRDLMALSMEGDAAPWPILNGGYDEMQGRFSPDMRWIAYASDETGRSEVYVRALSPAKNGRPTAGDRKWILSRNGGHSPRWRSDGRELYYLTPDGTLMSVEGGGGPDFNPGAPNPLFKTPRGFVAWDADADGKRFLFAVPEQPQAPFTVVLNWMELLKR